MKMPGFTADVEADGPTRFYRTYGPPRGAPRPATGISPQQGSGNYLGQACHNGVLVEVYMDWTGSGPGDAHVVEVGSC